MPPGSVVVVPVGTPIQLVNEGDEDSLVLIVAALLPRRIQGSTFRMWRHRSQTDPAPCLARGGRCASSASWAVVVIGCAQIRPWCDGPSGEKPCWPDATSLCRSP